MEKEIAIIIVNYNGEKVQGECLQSLKRQSLQNFDVIMIDNGSVDASVEKAKEIYDNIIIIKTNMNNGVAKGNNIGINYAMSNGYQYVLLLNNDTVLHELLIEKLFSESRKEYITAPKIFFYERKDLIWFAGGNINFNRGVVNHWGIFKRDIGQYDNIKEINYAPTCCLLIPIKVFVEIGIMDENYFMYYDDTDFCVRLNKQSNNTKILYIPNALLWHKVSSTAGIKSPLSIYYCNRNRFYFLKKFKRYFPGRAVIYTYITRIIRYGISLLTKSSDKYIKKAYIDYRKKLMGYRAI